jgi:hypothetical protein
MFENDERWGRAQSTYSRCHALYVVIAALSLIRVVGYSRCSAMPGTAAGLISSKNVHEGRGQEGHPKRAKPRKSTPDTDVER